MNVGLTKNLTEENENVNQLTPNHWLKQPIAAYIKS